MPDTTILPAIGPGGGLFDFLERMDDETLDAMSELLELQGHRTGVPVVVLPREPHTLH